MKRFIPNDCVYDGKGAGQCWGCPNIKCPYSERPFANKLNTERVIFTAVARIRLGDFPKISKELQGILKSEFDDDYRIADLLRDELWLYAGSDIVTEQAIIGYLEGRVTESEAARYAHRDKDSFRDCINVFHASTQTGTNRT